MNQQPNAQARNVCRHLYAEGSKTNPNFTKMWLSKIIVMFAKFPAIFNKQIFLLGYVFFARYKNRNGSTWKMGSNLQSTLEFAGCSPAAGRWVLALSASDPIIALSSINKLSVRLTLVTACG